ncbi:MAG: glycoside hydrolase family 18 protein [Prevotellaceae bacterium]|jgi:chitinase|nr:glycoside hydrolase family 18 protein [Prevotellaceae bacterium]
MKRIYIILFAIFAGNLCFAQEAKEGQRVVLAYVTSWSDIIPDPEYVTHINYAFGHVNSTFDGIRIDKEERLKTIVGLKERKASLKVLLSIGGWGSGRFSEMAANEANRKAFAADCKRVIDEFALDGVDLDWEFPTSSMAKISSSPDDTENFTLLMREIRSVTGADKMLTLASNAGAGYIDFKAVEPYVDFVNIMTYDIGSAPKHHAALYRSENSGWMNGDESVDAHVKAGIPINKLTLGMPFYGRGTVVTGNFNDYKNIITLQGFTEKWDDVSKTPYLVNSKGDIVCSFENAKSIGIKCKYLRDRGMLGAMYWDYDGDDEAETLRKAVYEGVMSESPDNPR